MENLKEKASLITSMDMITIVDAGIVLNKHIKLNEWVELKNIYEALLNAGLFKMKTKRQMDDVFRDLCDFLNYDYEFKKIKVDNNIVLGVMVYEKKSKTETKSIVFVSEPRNRKSAYELHFRLLQKQEKGCEHTVFDGKLISKSNFNLQHELESRYDNANLITIMDVPKKFDFCILYNLISNGYVNVFGRKIIPIFLITTEHLPKRNCSFDGRFDVFEIKKI